jgi:pyrimidine-nucleoside phosphorylase
LEESGDFMNMVDIISKKKSNMELDTEEINYFIENYTNGKIPDYQVSALLMAICFQKMNMRETSDLTMAMVNSGDILDLSNIEGIKVDKHSTGGVGDTTTLVLTPMVAALGIPVAKMSGRGLGHTGGTIDKLESFTGFSVEITEEQFIYNVNNNKIAIMGQTADLAPADKKLYALRDVTSTVENISLISSSIMSKKIAAGADAIVLDVKVGDGAFMKSFEDAKELAEAMVSIGKSVNRNTVAVISDMDQPLGFAVGNALEVKEAIDTLNGCGPEDLLELCLTLGSNMVVLAQKAKTIEEARKMLLKVIEDKSALKKLKQFIASQGGNPSQVDYTELLPKAKYIVEVKSEVEGYISRIDSQHIGLIAMQLGAGRATKEDNVDLAVGIVLNKKRGNKVYKGETLAYIHANDEGKIEEATKDIIESYHVTEESAKDIPLVYGVVK